ncbi:MAG: hypothetical protein NT154_40380 [Verrucomicrobia bacterium]|nr:hypothetical protein [Verrucomicrobiota bacterium]
MKTITPFTFGLMLLLAGLEAVLAQSPAKMADSRGNQTQPGTGTSGTKLEFTVETYVLDEAAREAYEQDHPPAHTLADLNAKLLTFDGAVQRYKDWLKAIDEIVRQFWIGAGLRNTISKAGVIDSQFTPLEKALRAELDSVGTLIRDRGGNLPARPVNPSVTNAWAQLPEALERKKVVQDPKEVKRLLDQLKAKGIRLQELVAGAMTSLTNVVRDQRVVQEARALEESLDKLKSEKSAAALCQKPEEAKAFASQAETELKKAGGDLLPRLHAVYQDLSDPFLKYIATRDELWRRIPNHGSVSGDGDTQFILVFEDQLDGRFHFVSVDPTKVIQARLRIGRKVTQELVALGGVAANAFGVPIPSNLLGGKGTEGADTVEFSKMTALETQYRKQNEIALRQLEAVRAFALREMANLSPQNADDIRKNLLRQLQMVLPSDATPDEK